MLRHMVFIFFQFIYFARDLSQVSDFNNRNRFLTVSRKRVGGGGRYAQRRPRRTEYGFLFDLYPGLAMSVPLH